MRRGHWIALTTAEITAGCGWCKASFDIESPQEAPVFYSRNAGTVMGRRNLAQVHPLALAGSDHGKLHVAMYARRSRSKRACIGSVCYPHRDDHNDCMYLKMPIPI